MLKRIFRRRIVKMRYFGRTVEVPCPRCGGDGHLDGGVFCFYCDGKGYREIEVED